MKCAVYTRVSTDNQAEVEFNSCEAQEAKIRSFIKSQEDMELLRVYSDPGFSGANLDRPGLQEMLKDIEIASAASRPRNDEGAIVRGREAAPTDGGIDVVIVYKMDRLTRSPRDFYHLIELFDKYGVDFISVTERFDTSTPSGRLLRNIMLTFAQFERELTSERTKDKLLERAGKGMWNGGFIPFGYKVENKKLVVNETEAKIVRDIYDAYASNACIDYCFREFGKLSKSQIAYILRNPIYTGKLRYAGRLYQGSHTPIISEEIFVLAQTMHKKKKRKMRLYKDYVLGGLIKCAECSSYMTPCHTNKKHKGRTRHYYYYRCTKTFKRDWNSCNTKQVNANRLEDYIFENLDRISNDRRYIDSLIFKLNNEASSDQKGLELNKECPEISPEIFANNLKSFLSGLPKRKGTERNLWTQKFIKKILYSKDEIAITLYYTKDFEKETAVYPASGRVGAAAGRSSYFGADKKIIPIGTYRDNHKEWLPLADEVRTYFKGSFEITP